MTQVHGRPCSKHLGTRNELWGSHSHAYQLHNGAYHHATRCCIWSTQHHGLHHGCYADLCSSSCHDGDAYYAGTCDLCCTHGAATLHHTRAACDLCCTHDTGTTSDICCTSCTGTNLCSDARASCDLAMLCTYTKYLFQSRLFFLKKVAHIHGLPFPPPFPLGLLLWNKKQFMFQRATSSCEVDDVK